MDLSSLSLIIIILIMVFGLCLSLWVLISNRRAFSNWLLVLLIFFAMSNLILSYIMNFSTNNYVALLCGRFAWATVLAGIVVFYYFIDYFPDNERITHPIKRLIVLFIGGVLFLLSAISPFVIKEVQYNSGAAIIVPGFLMIFYYLIIIGVLLLSFYEIYLKYLKSNKVKKEKIQLFIIGLLIFVCISLFFNALLPVIFGIENYTYIGDYSIIIFFSFAAYAIIKHHLFDIKLAIVRSVTYTLLLITLASIYTISTFIFSMVLNLNQSNSPTQTANGVVTSLLLIAVFQPLKRFFDKITNKLFYKDHYSTVDFYARLNKMLTQTTDLRSLLEGVSYEIGETLKSEQAFFFVYTIDGHYMSTGTQNHNKLPKKDALAINEFYSEAKGIVIASILKSDNPIRRLMVSHKIELILPLILESKIIGYFCLGEHMNSNYTNRDIRALSMISHELIIAIQNALAIQEIRRINTTLQQRINNATKELRSNNSVLRQLDRIKDEFISMASHQLRAPLTSVKGYLSMVIEGDAGKITDSQKKLLNEAYVSSERMVHLINDFLNVSRIQAGKFIIDKTFIDLSDIVMQEIDSLRPSANSRQLKFSYNKPKDFPMMNLDEGKIRQVIMNYADNAIYYSSEDTVIDVKLFVEDNEAVFMIKDNGIGVPVHERAKLFSRFYRASNARKQRPDGTGVGLYLAKKVVTAHGGQVIFESVENKGSTFGFRIPLPLQNKK